MWREFYACGSMDTQPQSPVTTVQELLAVHALRKEAVAKVSHAAPDVKSKLENANAQSNAAISELMTELAQFGDAVGGEVPRDNAYQLAYDAFLKNEALDDIATFQQLETALHQTYQHLASTQTNLPPSLQTLLQKQAATFSK